jgi:hypothetical protein
MPLLALTVGGIEAQTATDLPGADRALSPTVEDRFVIGTLDGAEWEAFGEQVQVRFGPEGNLFVFDGDNFRILKVDGSGNLLAEFGREGGGPGELRMPMGFVVLSNGEVVVTDLGNRAFVVYGPDGDYLRNVPLDLAAGLPAPGAIADYDAGIVSPPGGIRVRMGGPGGGSEAEPGRVIQRFDPSIEAAPEELFRAWDPPTPEDGPGVTLESEGGGSIQIGGMPRLEAFRAEVHLGVFPDGSLAVVDSVTWTVKRVSPDGALAEVIHRPIEPRPVTASIRDAEKKRRLAALEEGGTGGRQIRVVGQGGGGGMSVGADAINKMMQDQVEAMVFAEEIPVISNLGVDRSGLMWVVRSGEELGEGGPVDFVSPEGQYLGTAPAGSIRVPEAYGPDGLAAFVEEDELGVQRIEVKRILGFP